MVVYKCDRCDKTFDRKSNYSTHINRKNLCKITTQNDHKITANNRKKNEHIKTNLSCDQPQVCRIAIKCQYCNKVFKRNYNLKIHLESRCKIKTQINNEKQDIFKTLLQEMNQLKKENKKLKMKINKLETSHITFNVKNTHNGNITYNTLVAYGKENKRQFDKEDILNAIRGFGTEVELTKLIHFNDNFPEYHNVYINNIKDKYAMIYDGTRWILRTKDNVIEDIYDTNKDFVDERMDDFIESLDESRINALKRWLDTDDSSEKIKKIKEDIKLLLYNEKEKVIKHIDVNTIPVIAD